MDNGNLKSWTKEAIHKLPVFLEQMKDEYIPGRFKYSLTGDIKTSQRWGLGNTVFAVKTCYMLNRLDNLNIESTAKFIKSFQHPDGAIFDPFVQKKSRIHRCISALRNFDFNNLLGMQNKRAETRQSFAVLESLGKKPEFPFLNIPYTAEDIKRYIHSLNWKVPWGAASHFSHLIFFLKMNCEFFGTKSNETDQLINCAFEEINKYRQKDGSWYKHKTSLPDYQKINGAMKIMTAYSSAGKNNFDNPNGLIDLCFSSLNEGDACNHLNIICVLFHCLQKTDYRREEAADYCMKRLKLYQGHWWPDSGGFSFFPGKANRIYYGAKISEGLPEPDIHGTHLFLWGITLISDILGWRDELNLQFPIT